MAMLTPIPLSSHPVRTYRPPSRSLRNFSELRPTLGTVLQITADIGAIWAAFLFSWLVIGGNGSWARYHSGRRQGYCE